MNRFDTIRPASTVSLVNLSIHAQVQALTSYKDLRMLKRPLTSHVSMPSTILFSLYVIMSLEKDLASDVIQLSSVSTSSSYFSHFCCCVYQLYQRWSQTNTLIGTVYEVSHGDRLINLKYFHKLGTRACTV